jgi:hypothetical protein
MPPLLTGEPLVHRHLQPNPGPADVFRGFAGWRACDADVHGYGKGFVQKYPMRYQ